MALPNISPLDIAGGDSIYDAETAINTLIDQSIKNAAMNGSQELLIETQDGTNIAIAVPAARAGILSGCELTSFAALAANVEAGNFQGSGLSQSLSAQFPVSFAVRHATLPRIDIVYGDLDNPDTVAVLTGTPSATPTVPDLSLVAGNNAPFYYCWIDPTAASSPRDFVLYTAQVDATIPVQLGASLEGQSLRQNLPTTRKPIVFDPVALLFNADVIFVDCSAGAVAVNLPLPAELDERQIMFVDLTGDAPANTITIDANTTGGTTINGANTATITTAYGSLIVTCYNGVYYGK